IRRDRVALIGGTRYIAAVNVIGDGRERVSQRPIGVSDIPRDQKLQPSCPSALRLYEHAIPRDLREDIDPRAGTDVSRPLVRDPPVVRLDSCGEPVRQRLLDTQHAVFGAFRRTELVDAIWRLE